MVVRDLTGAIAVVTGAGAGIEGHLGHHARNLLPRPIKELAARQGLDR